MRRSTVLEGIQHEAELAVGSLGSQADSLKYLLLNVVLVDTQGTAANLHAVEHHIIGNSLDTARVGGEVLHILVPGCGERMMHSLPALVLLAVLEHREVNNPQEAELVRVNQAAAACHLQAQLAKGLSHNQRLVSNNQQQVTSLGTGCLLDVLKGLVRIEFLERRLDAFLSVLNPCQPLGTVPLYILYQAVQLATRNVGISLNIDNLYLSAIFQHGLEHLEVRALHMLGNIHQLHAEAHVRLVRAVALHSLIPGHAQELLRDFPVKSLVKNLTHHAFHHGQDGLLVDEGHLDVQLGKLRLAVSAQILIPEAAHNLEILLHAGQHENLLVNLRRLRQGIELARIQAARHQKVTGTLRSGLAEHRSLNLQKAVPVKVITHNLGNAMAQHEILLHLRAAQIKIAVLQAQHLIHLDAILDVERRSLCLVKDAQLLYYHLYHAGSHVRIYGFLGTGAHAAPDSHNELVADSLSLVECLLADGSLVNYHLHQTGAVTQVNKNQSAMVTAAGNPAAKDNLTAYMVSTQLTAVMGTLQTF